MLDVIIDTLIDSVKLLPFLFFTYLAMEYIEHKTTAKTKRMIKNSGKAGPLDRKSTRLNSSHNVASRMPSSA